MLATSALDGENSLPSTLMNIVTERIQKTAVPEGESTTLELVMGLKRSGEGRQLQELIRCFLLNTFIYE